MKRIFKRVKWLNVFITILFIVSCIDLSHVFFKLCWSIAGLSWLGVITTILSITVASTTGEYLYDQMQ